MRADLIELAADLIRRNEAFALVTVVRREAPSSARVGDAALVTAGGVFHGWLGGSCTQPTAVREALAALQDGAPRLIALSSEPDPGPRPGVTILPMTCHSGGSVDLYIEPVLPAPRLIVFGVSPTAQAVVRMAKILGYTVEAVDPEADHSLFPEADRVVTHTFAPEISQRAKGSHSLYSVIATLGENDDDAIRAALDLPSRYIGLVSSKKRFHELQKSLAEGGVDPVDLERVTTPAGLDLGATTPEEIALSILAEIVQTRQRDASAESARNEESSTTQDPVCGMTVERGSASHYAEFDGHMYFFCCAGCKTKFEMSPNQFVAI